MPTYVCPSCGIEIGCAYSLSETLQCEECGEALEERTDDRDSSRGPALPVCNNGMTVFTEEASENDSIGDLG